ncbi:unnamed protein product [Ambrosiozyma monospora]|uniref:Unnamed protein product n=1 Tax=Ambrosiozyma monospora TaxID=43982 RepID=A0A9W6YQZ7_AMBMO|nr:unnamed protein product [Ambrosiozyma monospora]
MSSQDPRFEKFRHGLRYVVNDILKKITAEKMAEMYPGIDKRALENIRVQIIQQYRNKCFSEFEKIYKDRDLEKKLDELDEIILDAKRRYAKNPGDKLYINDLNPNDIISNRLLAIQKESVASLNEKLVNLKRENNKLVKELNSIYNESLHNLKAANGNFGLLADVTKDELEDEKYEDLINYVTDECFRKPRRDDHINT